jgi:membrane protease subunit (stomatin/prohibitin family)
MFRMGMDGAVGVAHGAGGKEGSAPASSGSPAASATIECAKCSAVNLAKANFCKQCGHKLRT